MSVYTFNTLRKKVGQICGQSIGPQGFATVIQDARERGAFQNAEMQKTISEILLYLEANASDETKADKDI